MFTAAWSGKSSLRRLLKQWQPGSKPRPSPRKRDSCKERRVPLRLQPDMKDAPRFEFLQELHHQLFFLVVSPKLTRGAQINRQPMRERDRHRDFKTVVRKMAVIVAHIGQQ